MNTVFTLLAGLGILMALFGIGTELLPGAHPGLNLPQISVIAAGLALALVAFALRSATVRLMGRRVLQNVRKYGVPSLVITMITLAALELALTAAGIPTYFPPPIDDVPAPFYEPAPWWTCDEAGCHFVQEHVAAGCESGHLSDRECLIMNRQGFHDTQDFVVGDDFDGRMRILMLGDSFTFGMTADIGKSYVETIEANFPQSIVWNTGMNSAGTEQALASFQVYAPILQPQITILGFVMNDFMENILWMDQQIIGIDWENKLFRIRRQDIDTRSGSVIKLDYEELYYRQYHVDPPNSELEQFIGRTRLGSLLPRILNGIRWQEKNLYITQPVSLRNRIIDVTRRYLKSLRAAAAAQDTTLLVLVIQNRTDFTAPTPYYQAALQLFKELEMPYLDPIDVIDIRDYGNRKDPDEFHWNNTGHQKVGAMLSDCIEAFQISQDLSDCQRVKMPSSHS